MNTNFELERRNLEEYDVGTFWYYMERNEPEDRDRIITYVVALDKDNQKYWRRLG